MSPVIAVVTSLSLDASMVSAMFLNALQGHYKKQAKYPFRGRHHRVFSSYSILINVIMYVCGRGECAGKLR